MKKRSNSNAKSGSSPLICSRPSDTPETDAEIGRVHRSCAIMVCDEGNAMADFARKLERERDEAWDLLRSGDDLMRRAIIIADGWMQAEQWCEAVTQILHSENTATMAGDEIALPSVPGSAARISD